MNKIESKKAEKKMAELDSLSLLAVEYPTWRELLESVANDEKKMKDCVPSELNEEALRFAETLTAISKLKSSYDVLANEFVGSSLPDFWRMVPVGLTLDDPKATVLIALAVYPVVQLMKPVDIGGTLAQREIAKCALHEGVRERRPKENTEEQVDIAALLKGPYSTWNQMYNAVGAALKKMWQKDKDGATFEYEFLMAVKRTLWFGGFLFKDNSAVKVDLGQIVSRIKWEPAEISKSVSSLVGGKVTDKQVDEFRKQKIHPSDLKGAVAWARG